MFLKILKHIKTKILKQNENLHCLLSSINVTPSEEIGQIRLQKPRVCVYTQVVYRLEKVTGFLYRNQFFDSTTHHHHHHSSLRHGTHKVAIRQLEALISCQKIKSQCVRSEEYQFL